MTLLIASSPHEDTFGYSMPPPGLLRLGGYLEARGHAVALDDLAFALARGEIAGDDRLAETAAVRLLEREPTRLGLSVMGATLPIAIAIAAEVRARASGLPIWIGGPGTTGVDEALLERFPWIDVVVRGEGELTVDALLTADGPQGIEGLTWRAADGSVRREVDRAPMSMADVSPYAWHLLPEIAHYKALTGEAEGLVPLDSGRGCVYDCSFCTIGRYWSRRSRTLPVDRLVDEIRSLKSIEGARNAYLCHDLFGADRRYSMQLCEALAAEDSDIPWEVRARLDHLDDELIGAMADAGCYRVLVGVESADGAVRNANSKRMDTELDVVDRLGRLGDAGIVPILSLILGLPGESDAELASTLDLCVEAALRTGVQLSLHLVNPQPGCGLGESHGATSRPVDGIDPDMALGTGKTAPERLLIGEHPDLFSTYALLTGLPGGEERLRFLSRVSQVFAPLVMRYPASFALLARRREADALATFRALDADGRSFEALCALERCELLDEVLAWEQAKAHAATTPEPEAASVPRPAGRLLRFRHDIGAALAALEGNSALPNPVDDPIPFLVTANPDGVRTSRISRDVAEILDSMDGRDVATLEDERPGFSALLPLLVDKGLALAPNELASTPKA